MHSTEALGGRGFQGPKAFGANLAIAARRANFSLGGEKFGLAVTEEHKNAREGGDFDCLKYE